MKGNLDTLGVIVKSFILKSQISFSNCSGFVHGSRCFLFCIMMHIDEYLIVGLHYYYGETIVQTILSSLSNTRDEKAYLHGPKSTNVADPTLCKLYSP